VLRVQLQVHCVIVKKNEKYLLYCDTQQKKTTTIFVASAAHGCGSGRYRMGR